MQVDHLEDGDVAFHDDVLRKLEGRHVGPSPGAVDREEPQAGDRHRVDIVVRVRDQLIRLRSVKTEMCPFQQNHNVGCACARQAASRTRRLPLNAVPAAELHCMPFTMSRTGACAACVTGTATEL